MKSEFELANIAHRETSQELQTAYDNRRQASKELSKAQCNERHARERLREAIQSKHFEAADTQPSFRK